MGFYPIIVIQYFGVVERPLMLVLFDSNGDFVNAVKLADSYGETGGWMKSRFINDSTIIQDFKHDEFGLDSLGNDVFESTYSSGKVVIQNDGKITAEEIEKN